MSDVSDDLPVFPHLSGLNWPSYLLQAVLTLRALGVPEENLRLIPTLGHFAEPEVGDSSDPSDDPDEGMPDAAPFEMRHPRGPRYDSAAGRLILQRVSDPTALYPRLGVNVRSDTASEDWGADIALGRLAHFVNTLMADPPGTPPGEAGQRPGETPMGKLTRQIAALFPELTDAMPERVRSHLRTILSALEAALLVPDDDDDPERGEMLLTRALETLAPWAGRGAPPPGPARQNGEERQQELLALQTEFLYLLSRVGTNAARSHLAQWADLMILTDPSEQARHANTWLADMRETPGAASEQARLVYEMQGVLEFEAPRERLRVIRHLLEILTTEALLSVAAIDHLWGIAWLHGPLPDFGVTIGPNGQRKTGDDENDNSSALLLSVTGGQHPHSLLLTRIRAWAGASAPGARGFLGVPAEALTDAGFTSEEQDEIWSLVTWRRQTADPLALFEIALARLVHPEIRSEMRRYTSKAGRYNTLWAQPGRTAVPGGRARLFAPSLDIWLPFAEDSGPLARQAEKRVHLLASLLVPVTLPLRLVWQEAVARLGDSYLSHPLQKGVRLTGSGIIEED